MNESEFIYSLTDDQRKAYNALKVLRQQKVTTELDKALTELDKAHERLIQIRTNRDKRDDNLFSSEEPSLTDTIICIEYAMYYSTTATSQLELEL